jgi:hypothetical protein
MSGTGRGQSPIACARSRAISPRDVPLVRRCVRAGARGGEGGAMVVRTAGERAAGFWRYDEILARTRPAGGGCAALTRRAGASGFGSVGPGGEPYAWPCALGVGPRGVPLARRLMRAGGWLERAGRWWCGRRKKSRRISAV